MPKKHKHMADGNDEENTEFKMEFNKDIETMKRT